MGPGTRHRADEVFVGREEELALLGAAWSDACEGRPKVVLIEGPAGMGKTALGRRFVASLGGAQVLRASGEELERMLPCGVVDQLGAAAHAVAPGQSLAGPEVDPLAVGAVLLGLLGSVQDHGPLVLVLDDAHWADWPSLHALIFALRRLQADRVLAVLTAREEELNRLPESLRRLVASERGLRLRLGGLNTAEVRALASSLGTGPLGAGAAARLREHTGGSPLHTRALLEELPAATLGDSRGPLPSPPSYALVVLGRLAACPLEVQDLVVAAAVLGTPCPLDLAARLADLEQPLGLLEQAVAARLLEARGGAGELIVDFPHPLLRSAVYHDLGPARRAHLHAEAATLGLDPEEALRHRVAAASGPDPDLVGELVQSSRQQAAQGAWTAAADALRSAARLARGVEKEDLLLDAADLLLVGGYVGEAASLLEEDDVSTIPSPRRRYVQARLASTTGHQSEAAALLIDAWERSGPAGDHNFRAQVAGLLANVCIIDLRWADGALWAQRALEEAQAGGAAVPYAMAPLILGIGLSGRMDEALAMMGFIPDPPPPDLGPDGLSAVAGRGTLRLWTDDFEGARRDYLLVADAPWRWPMQHRLFALAGLVNSEYMMGLWDDAVVDGELSTSTGRDTDQIWVQPLLHAMAVLALAGRGEWEAADAHAQAAVATAAVLGDELGTCSAGMAVAVVAAGREDFDAVVAATRPLLGLERLDNLADPGILPWRGLLADGLVYLGRLDEAEAILGQYEVAAQHWGRNSTMGETARIRGRLEAARGRREEAEKAFLSGLAVVDPARLPFEAARIELDYGSFLRRTGRRRAASEYLHSAQARFARLDAAPWLERCERELAGSGLSPGPRRTRDRTRLTPQELTVATCAASGLSNREVASKLVVSTKTVEFHLANVFAKLGISSRSQLSGVLNQSPLAD